ncbi:hypothetical protein [Ilumatobacter sp.]|uniref:hypothetical protein n=1 Tax=Ilumatobacter sp. TaxID=1967498 RepID=UPI003B51CD47
MLKRFISATCAMAAVVAVTQLTPVGTASAYYPDIDGAPTCLEDGSWQVTWTVGADTVNYPEAPWRVITPEGYAPAGILDPEQTASRTATYDASQLTATEDLVIYWYEVIDGVQESRLVETGGTVSQPADCDVPPPSDGGEWCSPGYWRQPHHLDSWAATGYATDTKYGDVIDSPSVKGDPTLLEVLQNPQIYKGRAFNAVGDLLSAAHPDIDFDGERVDDSCTLN